MSHRSMSHVYIKLAFRTEEDRGSIGSRWKQDLQFKSLALSTRPKRSSNEDRPRTILFGELLHLSRTAHPNRVPCFQIFQLRKFMDYLDYFGSHLTYLNMPLFDIVRHCSTCLSMSLWQMFAGASIELRAVRRSVFFCGNAVAPPPEASSCGPKMRLWIQKKKHHRTSAVYSKKKQKGLVASRQLALQWEHKQWVSQKSLIDFAVQMQSNQTHGVREPNVTSIKPHANVQTRCVAVRLFESHHGSSAFIVESNFQ